MGECATRTLPVLARFVIDESLIAGILYTWYVFIIIVLTITELTASLNIINSALHSQASALLQLW